MLGIYNKETENFPTADSAVRNKAKQIEQVAPSIRRAPLFDLSNQQQQQQQSTQSVIKTTSSKMNLKEEQQSSTWYAVNKEKELESALCETLEENKRVHDICKLLIKENSQLKERLKQLDLVTMLYDGAKTEVEELQAQLEKIKNSNQKNNTRYNKDT